MTEKVRDGEDVLIPLTEQSSDSWALHLKSSSVILTFDRVTQQESGGLHLWSDVGGTVFVAEKDTRIGDKILEKLIELAE